MSKSELDDQVARLLSRELAVKACIAVVAAIVLQPIVSTQDAVIGAIIATLFLDASAEFAKRRNWEARHWRRLTAALALLYEGGKHRTRIPAWGHVAMSVAVGAVAAVTVTAVANAFAGSNQGGAVQPGPSVGGSTGGSSSGPNSNPGSSSGSPPQTPAKPTASQYTNQQPSLHWNSVPGATDYVVYRQASAASAQLTPPTGTTFEAALAIEQTDCGSPSGTVSESSLGEDLGETSLLCFTDTSLATDGSADGTYTYSVVAANVAGTSQPGDVTVTYDLTPPACPTGLSIAASRTTTGDLTASWSSVAQDAGTPITYELSVAGAAPVSIPDDTTSLDFAPPLATTYEVSLVTTDAAGNQCSRPDRLNNNG